MGVGGGEAPDKTGAHKSDFTPFTTTRCCLKHRKESIHFNVLPQSIANQFAFKGCNKCLFKIQYECVNLSSIVQTFSPVIYYRSQLSRNIFFCLFVAGPTGVQLLGFLCSSVPVVLFDTPGVSRFRSQHFVSVKSSSLFHHSIYPVLYCPKF